MAKNTSGKTTGVDDNYHPYSFIAPRFWHGMTLPIWLRLLARNRLAISPTRIPLALAITGFTTMNSVLRGVEELLYRRRVNAIQIEHAPIFILGHWRSGTTLLHELLISDPRHTYPNTYECFAPHHFLLTEKLLTRLLAFILPAQRPMDNMAAGWSRPQEDEFAMTNLGIPSPYLSMAFPKRGPVYPEYLDLTQLSHEQISQWQDTLIRFLKRITYHSNRRIVLKSPPHTARIRTLLKIFPDARFVHIVRDPYTLFPSTVRMWRSLNRVQGLQVAQDDWLEEYVLDCFDRLYRRFEEDRPLLASNRFYEVRYEDLVSDPMTQMRAIYDQLELGDFDEATPRVLAYLDDARDYKTNRYDLSAEMHDRVTQRWGDFIRRYGYERKAPEPPSSEPPSSEPSSPEPRAASAH